MTTNEESALPLLQTLLDHRERRVQALIADKILQADRCKTLEEFGQAT